MAVVVLFAVSFAVGRATVSTTHRSPVPPPIAPASAGLPGLSVVPGPALSSPDASVAHGSGESCRLHRPC